MSVKDFIYCLTLLLCVLPHKDVKASVKDILNNQERESFAIDVHQRKMVTQVSEVRFDENLGDGKSIVVIDAGHGGHDPGALGKYSKEKEIALSIALKIGKQINSIDPTIHVIYTRKKDVFIPLHQRISLANKEKADLFISIHCNYVDNPHVCGTETFVMGLHRAEENLNVAKRENSAVLLESGYENNYEGYDPNSPIGHILLSMFQNIFLENSIELASNVESYLAKRKKTKSRGVKQAGLVVLRQATMPSILVETGFLSNPKEEAYLMSEKGQKEMSNSIGKGIISYFSEKAGSIVSNSKPPTAERSKNFIVQIGAFSKPIDDKVKSNLEGHGTLIQNEVNGLFKYSIGYFNHKTDANLACKQLKESGFSDAFVKSYAAIPSK